MLGNAWNYLLHALVQRGFFDITLSSIENLFIKLSELFLKIIHYVIRKLKKALQIVDFAINFVTRFWFALITPVQKNKVLFLTFQGDYTCNPKGIAEELIRRNTDLDLCWVVKGTIPKSDYPLALRFVTHTTFEFYQEVASARVIIENTNILERLGVTKKKNQILLQTWHGSLGIKRLDGDVVMGWKWKIIAKRCQKMVNYCLSNSTFETKVFETSYWKGVPSLLVGHARNDIFFADDTKKEYIRWKVYRFLNISRDRKIFLYAPTHKDTNKEVNLLEAYKQIHNALKTRFGGEWQIVIRFHSRAKTRKPLLRHYDYITDATNYEDMQELLVSTDIGVTDYSSWIFDYMLTKKPCFLLCKGLDVFEVERGFYYPLDETPFPIAKTDEELVNNILTFDEEKYAHERIRFLKDRGCMEDGHASERIADKILAWTGRA